MTKRLYRQINPQFAPSGNATYLAFSPMNHDHISVDDADKVSAESAWQTYSEIHDSAGVMAVTDEECEAHSLSVASNPTLHRPAHMDIGFEKLPLRKAGEMPQYGSTHAPLGVVGVIAQPTPNSYPYLIICICLNLGIRNCFAF